MLKAGIGMERLSKEEYLENPCGYASIPYWKAKKVCVSEEMRIVHNSAYDRRKYAAYSDEPYFRLLHPLKKPCAPVLPQGYSCGAATLREFAEHINRCYGGACVSEEKLRDYTARPVYDERLWLAVRNGRTGELAATGIAELDREIGEGILEWIQVSEDCRGRGLGRYLVSELLWRMRGRALFATVSGQCNNPSQPERLYRGCGFTGDDVWHVLRKKA